MPTASKKTRKQLEKELAELQKQVSASGSAPSAEPAKAMSPEEQHQHRMATDRNYAEQFLRNSAPKGRIFTVTMECVDPMASMALFQACRARGDVLKLVPEGTIPPVGPLLAGCHVLTVYTVDLSNELVKLKATLGELAK